MNLKKKKLCQKVLNVIRKLKVRSHYLTYCQIFKMEMPNIWPYVGVYTIQYFGTKIFGKTHISYFCTDIYADINAILHISKH